MQEPNPAYGQGQQPMVGYGTSGAYPQQGQPMAYPEQGQHMAVGQPMPMGQLMPYPDQSGQPMAYPMQGQPMMVGQPMPMGGQPMMMAMQPQQQPMMMVPQPGGAMMAPAGYIVTPILAPDLLSGLGRLKGAYADPARGSGEAGAYGRSRQRSLSGAVSPS